MDVKRITVQFPHRMTELIGEAARRQCTSRSEYARQALVQALRSDGFEPAAPTKEVA